jgi:hypothetical protein
VANRNGLNADNTYMRLIPVIFVLLGLVNSVKAMEMTFPSNSLVSSSYVIDQSSISTGDTILITRTVVNNESYSLAGFYLGDNFPTEFDLVAQTIELNATPVTHSTVGPSPSSTVAGYNSYHWLIDDPVGFTVNNLINPGDSLHFEIRLVCNVAGTYQLDLHTGTAYGNGSGLFFTSTSNLSLTVTLTVSVDDDDGNLPSEFLTSNAYPNPFNGSVCINYEGVSARSRKVQLEIYDVLGRLAHQEVWPVQGNQGSIRWESRLAGSGVYYYRLSDGVQFTSGKLVLLK